MDLMPEQISHLCLPRFVYIKQENLVAEQVNGLAKEHEPFITSGLSN